MRKTWFLVGVAALISVTVAVPAISATKTTLLQATLKGNAEVPDRGDKNGNGDALIGLKPKRKKVCYKVVWEKLTDVTAAHIHRGAEGVAGPVKITLAAPASPLPGDGFLEEDCVKDVKRKLIRRMKKNPAKFYVNVHSSDYPNGAIRGQLEKIAAG